MQHPDDDWLRRIRHDFKRNGRFFWDQAADAVVRSGWDAARPLAELVDATGASELQVATRVVELGLTARTTDVAALLGSESGGTLDIRARLSADRAAAAVRMVFYNQLSSPDGSVRHGGEQTLGSADLFEELQVDLPIVPDHVAAIAVCASVHGRTFVDVAVLHVRLEGDTILVFAVPALSTERAVVLFEFYRRAGTWKVRAVGKGYDDGLAGLARDFGVEVA